MKNQVSSPLVSIIIPHFNNFSIINRCLKSLNKLTYDNVDIIAVDNNSSDNSVELLRDNFKDIKIVELDENLGYAGGCNHGVKYSKGEYLIFLNNDTTHDIDFIEPLIEQIISDDKIACVQPKIKNLNKKDYFDYAGSSGGFIDYLGYPFCRGRLFNTIEEDYSQYNDNKKVFWTSGACFITRKDIFNQIGGFDQKLFAHMEEIDYCWRCYLAGYENWVVPKSIIFHEGGSTLKFSSPHKTYLNHRNSLILILTNYSFKISLKIIIVRFFLEILSSFYDLIRFRVFHFIAHYKALCYLVFNINYLLNRIKLNKKIRIKNNQLIIDEGVIFKNSIVYLYFVKRLKVFSKLKF